MKIVFAWTKNTLAKITASSLSFFIDTHVSTDMLPCVYPIHPPLHRRAYQHQALNER